MNQRIPFFIGGIVQWEISWWIYSIGLGWKNTCMLSVKAAQCLVVV